MGVKQLGAMFPEFVQRLRNQNGTIKQQQNPIQLTFGAVSSTSRVVMRMGGAS
jgi:hypothetical protein